MAENKAISFVYSIIDRYSEVIDHMSKKTGMFESFASRAGVKMEESSHKTGLFGKAVGAILTAGSLETIASKAFEFGKKSLEAFEKAELGAAQLKQTLKNLEGTGRPTFEELQKSAEKLGKNSLFTKSDIIANSFGSLVKYSAVGVFGIDKVSVAAQNMAFSINKFAKGTDLAQASNMLGRVLQDPFKNADRMLRQYHIAFTNSDVKLMEQYKKTNNEVAARAFLFNKIANAPGVKGAMEAEMGTGTGKRLFIEKQMEEFQEKIGSKISPIIIQIEELALKVMPLLDKAFEYIGPIIETVSNGFTYFIAGLQAINTRFPFLLRLLAALAIAFVLINVILAANPFVLIVAGITLLIIAIGYLATHWNEIWNGIIAWVNKAIDSVKKFFVGIWNFIMSLLNNPLIRTLGLIFMPFVTIPLLIIKNWKDISVFIGKEIDAVLKIIKPVTDFLGLTKGSTVMTTTTTTPIVKQAPVNINSKQNISVYTENGMKVAPYKKPGNLGYNAQYSFGVP